MLQQRSGNRSGWIVLRQSQKRQELEKNCFKKNIYIKNKKILLFPGLDLQPLFRDLHQQH